jgi:hypothetical protein
MDQESAPSLVNILQDILPVFLAIVIRGDLHTERAIEICPVKFCLVGVLNGDLNACKHFKARHAAITS